VTVAEYTAMCHWGSWAEEVVRTVLLASRELSRGGSSHSRLPTELDCGSIQTG